MEYLVYFQWTTAQATQNPQSRTSNIMSCKRRVFKSDSNSKESENDFDLEDIIKDRDYSPTE